MKKMTNQTHIEGYLYEHKLELRESGPNSKKPGTKFIMGTIDIATDENITNIVPKNNSIMEHGKENAVKLRVDSALGLNDFYTDRNGKEELVSAKRNEGGFVHVADSLSEDENVRNTFKCDMLITGVKEVEADEERGLPEKVVVRGAIFDFRNALLPVEFSAVNPKAMDYFIGLDASNTNPTFTCVWGRQVSETVVKTIVEESAFGEDYVREVKNTRKDFVITGASKEPYLWDDESTLTAAEVAEAVATRETYLATVKQRADEYKASKNATATATPSATGFNF